MMAPRSRASGSSGRWTDDVDRLISSLQGVFEWPALDEPPGDGRSCGGCERPAVGKGMADETLGDPLVPRVVGVHVVGEVAASSSPKSSSPLR